MEPAIFGPLDAVLGPPVIGFVVFALVVANLGTRLLAHRTHVAQAADGADAIRRHRAHQAVNWLLVLASFYYTTWHQHSGIVLSSLVLGMVITDFFEFESRKVEARQGWALDRPKGALFASLLVLAYAFFISLFFLIEPLWSAIV